MEATAHALLHMVKMLDQKGLCLEDFFRFSDQEVTGRVSKNTFEKIMRKLGIPCAPKDLTRIISHYSEGTKLDIVNYHAFLKDAHVHIKNEQKQQTPVKDVPSSFQRNWSARIRVLLDVRFMLIETTSKMKKQRAFVNGMFAKLDSDMTGSITSIQLIRVLVQLRVILTEKDQDVLIGFLDSTSCGRVDYRYLLEFCYPKLDFKLNGIRNECDLQTTTNLKEIKSPERMENDCYSGKIEQPSSAVIPNMMDHGHPNLSRIQPMSVVGNMVEKISVSPILVTSLERQALEVTQQLCNFPPICSDNQYVDEINIDKKTHIGSGGYSEAANLRRDIFAPMLDTLEQGYTMNNSTVDSEENDYQDESFDVSISEHDLCEGSDGSLQSIGADASLRRSQTTISNRTLDANRTIDESNAKLIAIKIEHEKIGNHGEFLEDENSNRPLSDGNDGVGMGCKSQAPKALSVEVDSGILHPSPHNMPSEKDLHLSTNKILVTIRDMVLIRYRAGKPLTEIFRHFDRIGKTFFDAKDFLIGTADLRIDISYKVAVAAVRIIALDGCDNVSLGEFLVYILDPNHRILQDSIVKQMAEQLDKQGRVFQTLFHSLLRDKLKPSNRALLQASGLISTRVLISSIRKLGLALSQIDISRLVRRFDTNGTGITCSAVRFINMIEKSEEWKQSEGILVDHEIALNESAMLRSRLEGIQYSNVSTSQSDNHSIQNMEHSIDLDEDMICMAEYLGIKVISEPHLLWIVRDAVTSQLPSPWILRKHNTGRSCYFNQDTDVTSWSHPLDQKFRILRDQHRLKSTHEENNLPKDLLSIRTPTDSIKVFNHRSDCPIFVRSLSSDDLNMNNQSTLNDSFKQRLTVSEKSREGLMKELKRGKQSQLPQQKEYWAMNILNSRALKDFENPAFVTPFPSTLNNFYRSSRNSDINSSNISQKDEDTEIRDNKREKEISALPKVPNPLKNSTGSLLRPVLTSKANLILKKQEISQTESATWASPSIGGTNFICIEKRIPKTSNVVNRFGGNDKRKEKKRKNSNHGLKTDLSVVDRLMIINENRKS